MTRRGPGDSTSLDVTVPTDPFMGQYTNTQGSKYISVLKNSPLNTYTTQNPTKRKDNYGSKTIQINKKTIKTIIQKRNESSQKKFNEWNDRPNERRNKTLMPCYHPMQAWHSKVKNDSGKRSLVFNSTQAYQSDNPIEIQCGQCIGCRLERSRQWAIRCLHEASLHEDNCFITLTFSEEGLQQRENDYIKINKKRKKPKPLPRKDSVFTEDNQLFMKKLRKKYGSDIRFYHCGEYGDANKRPHYHSLLFNFDFPDKKLLTIKNGERHYVSEILEGTENYKINHSHLFKNDNHKKIKGLWPYGMCIIGDVTFESAAYVARYIMKKKFGKQAEEHYKGRKPEYTTMSRNPGIAKKWFDKYKTDLYPSDFIVVNRNKCNVPKYYDKLLEKYFTFEYEVLKDKRIDNMDVHHPDLTEDRLAVREIVQTKRLEQLVRNHDREKG